jgi:hypothetical protein
MNALLIGSISAEEANGYPRQYRKNEMRLTLALDVRVQAHAVNASTLSENLGDGSWYGHGRLPWWEVPRGPN